MRGRMWRRSVAAAVGVSAAVGLIAACKDAEFAGGTRQRVGANAEPDQKQNLDPKPENPDVPATLPPGTGTQTGTGTLGTGTDTGTFPDLTTGTDTGTRINWIDLIGGLVTILREVEIDRPENNENEIIFGRDKVFHIGDNNFNRDSECAARIRAYPLRGTRYFFEFEVLQDQTMVDVGVREICGIDYRETDWMSFNSASGQLETRPLSKGTDAAAFTGKLLNKGKYTVVIESRPAGQENPGVPNDHDDFIVGKVHIKADKPLRPGRVGAE